MHEKIGGSEDNDDFEADGTFRLDKEGEEKEKASRDGKRLGDCDERIGDYVGIHMRRSTNLSKFGMRERIKFILYKDMIVLILILRDIEELSER